MENWLNECKAAGAPGTHERYSLAGRQFLEYLNATEKATLAPRRQQRGRARLSGGPAQHPGLAGINLSRKILSAFFNHAITLDISTVIPSKAPNCLNRRRPTATEARAGFDGGGSGGGFGPGGLSGRAVLLP